MLPFLLNSLSFLLALVLALQLNIRPRSLLLLTTLLLHVLVIQSSTLLLGLAGGYTPAGWWTLAGTLAAVTAGLAFWNRKGVARAAGDAWQRLARVLRVLGPWRVAALTLAVTGVSAWLALAGYAVGPYLPDVTTYHLTPAADWIAQGKLAALPWLDSRCHWPQGQGLLAAWHMGPARDLRLSLLAELHWLLLAVASTGSLAANLTRRTRACVPAVLFSLCVPMLWAQAVSGLNDLAIASLVLAALAVCSARQLSVQHLLLVLVICGVGTGIKPTMITLSPVLLLLAGARHYSQRQRSVLRLGHPAWWAAVLLACAGVGLYWYASNLSQFGNPLYPAPLRLMGVTLHAGESEIGPQVQPASTQLLATNLRSLVTEKMWDLKPLRHAQTPGAAGFGILAAGPGLLALLWLSLRQARVRPFALVIGLAAVLTASSINDDPWNGRFFLFVPLFLCVSLAVLLTAPGPRRGLQGVRWRIALLGVLLPLAWLSLLAGLQSTLPPLAVQYWKEHGWLSPVPLGALNFTQSGHLITSVEAVPEDATVLVVKAGTLPPAAVLHGPRLTRKLVYLSEMPTPAEAERWKEEGARYLCLSSPMRDLPAARLAVLRAGWKEIAAGVFEWR